MSRQRLVVLFSVLVVIAASAIPAAAQTVPRTLWGDPDLGGIWDYRTITPMQRPERYGDRAYLTEEEAAELEAGAEERGRAAAAAPVGTKTLSIRYR